MDEFGIRFQYQDGGFRGLAGEDVVTVSTRYCSLDSMDPPTWAD